MIAKIQNGRVMTDSIFGFLPHIEPSLKIEIKTETWLELITFETRQKLKHKTIGVATLNP